MMAHYNLVIDRLPRAKAGAPEEIAAHVAKLGGTPCQIQLKTAQDGSLYAYCEAPTQEVFEKLLAASGTVWEGARLEVRTPEYKQPIERMVHVRDLPEDPTSEEIAAAFSQFGKVEGVVLRGDADNQFGFVTFEEAGAREAALRGARDCRVREHRIMVTAAKPTRRASQGVTLASLHHRIGDLSSRVASSTDYRGVKGDFVAAHQARHDLFGTGEIGLTELLALEGRLNTAWNIMAPRLQGAVDELKANIASSAEDIASVLEGWSDAEQFHRCVEGLTAILDAMNILPPDRYGALNARIRPVIARARNHWFATIERRFQELEGSCAALPDPASLQGSDALREHYRSVSLLRERTRELSDECDDPPLGFQYEARFRPIYERKKALRQGLARSVAQAAALLRAEAAAIVASMLERFHALCAEESASPRDCLELSQEIRDIVSENKTWVAQEEWQRFQAARKEIEARNHRDRAALMRAVKQLSSEVAAASPNRAEELLENVKALHTTKKGIVLQPDMLGEITGKLKGAWEQLTRQVAIAHRMLTESLTREMSAVEAKMSIAPVQEVQDHLKSLFDRARKSRLSYRHRNALEDKLDQLFARLRERKNENRDRATALVQSIEDSLESDQPGTAAALRSRIKTARDQINRLELSDSDRRALHQRLEAVWRACDEELNQAASRLEPQVAECERMAKEGKFDVVFRRIHQLHQEVGEIGVSRQTWAIRERLNQAWAEAQKKQSAVAGELGSLLDDRLAACERLAGSDDDFTQVYETLNDAEEAFRSKPAGLRLAANYRERLDAAWANLHRREREVGNKTKQMVQERAARIRGLLSNQSLMGQVFNALYELSDLHRSRWKNKEDMDSLRGLVDGLWWDAKRQATQQKEAAMTAAQQSIERCTYLARFWFDWEEVLDALDKSDDFVRTLPLFHTEKEKLLTLVVDARSVASKRRREDIDERFSYDWLIFRRWYCIQRGMVQLRKARWPADKLDPRDLSERDLFILAQVYDIVPRCSTDRDGNPFQGVELDETTLDHMIIRKFRLPRNWYQPWTRIRIDFPATYPTSPPIGWYMDPDLNLKDWKAAPHYFPNKAFHGAQAHAGWAWYCAWVEAQKGAGSWCPPGSRNPRSRDNLWSFLEVIRGALASDDA